ncbi:MAG: GNAT family N-acetyltransferase [Gemmatimonadetes bacterium]|nr:GNAT family N-acetyltransferase [Gemmatimonadota bacterium]MYD25688.1 GNAT family N-acetyltransferase [Gemmatimonadota bacterium]MYI98116.1 GNAT family N-acetyltransferase [Gemmatimonadota bacterium]
MYTPIADKTLRTGETLEIGVVLAPDNHAPNGDHAPDGDHAPADQETDDNMAADHAPLVRPILAHKSSNEQWHLDEVFASRVDPLETRFYLGRLDGRSVCNIMVSEHDGIGIVSHVYTMPEHRRKGIARLVMTEQMADFQVRSGRYLTLSTGYDTHPYYLYHGFGFRSVVPESGHMKYMRHAEFEAAHFRVDEDGEARVIPGDWKHWPSLNVLCAQDGPPFLRNVGLGHVGPRMFEGAYLELMKQTRDDEDVQVRLVVTERGAVVGYATLVPDARWRGETLLLDLTIHAAFRAQLKALLESFALPFGRKVLCHVEPGDGPKTTALEGAGFIHEATLRQQFKAAGNVLDVEVYARYA